MSIAELRREKITQRTRKTSTDISVGVVGMALVVKIGAKVVRHARYVTFQMAEVAVDFCATAAGIASDWYAVTVATAKWEIPANAP